MAEESNNVVGIFRVVGVEMRRGELKIAKKFFAETA